MWWGSSAISSVGRSAHRRRCTAAPAATVAYVTATPCRSRGSGPAAFGRFGSSEIPYRAASSAHWRQMWVVGATTATRATRPSASIRCATCRPNVVLPAAGVAEARNASPA